MKKYTLLIFLIFVLCFSSCCPNFDKPDSVRIEEKEYTRAFIGDLFPIDDSFMDSNSITVFGNHYYKYSNTPYDCYISYDTNGKPNIYFESETFDEATSYYKDSNNFDFFCLLGNIHDENEQQILKIDNVDSSMFNSLLEFSKENEYNPLTSFNEEDGLKEVPIADQNNLLTEEIHFYKASKDGTFTTSQGYTFIILENKLSFLYQYDFSNDEAPTMLIRDIPKELNDYFLSFLSQLNITFQDETELKDSSNETNLPAGDDVISSSEEISTWGESETSIPVEMIIPEEVIENLSEEIITPSVITDVHEGANADSETEVNENFPTSTTIEVIDGITYVNGILIVNKTYPLPENYAPQYDQEVLDSLSRMFSDGAAAGYTYKVKSGYRSYIDQKIIYNNYVSRDGKALADTYSARPGHSEHQSGLAFDLNQLLKSFGDTPEGIWLAENCHKYGFIIRYPKGKEHITGYMYEPWHVRYLGVDIATKVYESGLCLEEYLGITSEYSY